MVRDELLTSQGELRESKEELRAIKDELCDKTALLWDPFPCPTSFGGSEPSPRCPVITQSFKIQSLRKRFQNLGKPINIYI